MINELYRLYNVDYDVEDDKHKTCGVLPRRDVGMFNGTERCTCKHREMVGGQTIQSQTAEYVSPKRVH